MSKWSWMILLIVKTKRTLHKLTVGNPAGPWGHGDPQRLKCQSKPYPPFLPGESREQRNSMGYSPWGSQRVRTRLSNQLHFSLWKQENSPLVEMSNRNGWQDTPIPASSQIKQSKGGKWCSYRQHMHSRHPQEAEPMKVANQKGWRKYWRVLKGGITQSWHSSGRWGL